MTASISISQNVSVSTFRFLRITDVFTGKSRNIPELKHIIYVIYTLLESS